MICMFVLFVKSECHGVGLMESGPRPCPYKYIILPRFFFFLLKKKKKKNKTLNGRAYIVWAGRGGLVTPSDNQSTFWLSICHSKSPYLLFRINDIKLQPDEPTNGHSWATNGRG